METDIANKVIEYRTKNHRFNQILNNIYIRWIIYLLMRIHVIYMLSYSLVSFTTLDSQQWTSILSEVYFFGHFIYIGWFIVSMLFNYFIPIISSQPFSCFQSTSLIFANFPRYFPRNIIT
ncbi:Lysophosphatidylcholine acyltransferase 3, variant 3 [Dermatophagoides farinae]|uniref:Lysophosphatidylcholine acyltransferase 3, variant 3 n=1 Tax=Dermatophagoides farinae TaxID=6954 RepID=A0A922HN42_DERFA|nr:Lysophosphatidylcholine acyltransferase 3, variant 3 [Dermatophagoides farinae]